MAIIHITEATGGLPNSGRLSGTDGDLVGILDVGLPLNGMAIEYTATNARIYRAGSGNRFRLYVNDQASISGAATFAVVRGCENASAASNASITDAFPTAAKIADGSSNWIKSSTANTTARAFDILVAPTWIAYAVNFNGSANVWDFGWFGDFVPTLSGDPYATACAVRNTSATTVSSAMDGTNAATGNICWNICRSCDGTVKSTTGGVQAYISGKIGAITTAPQAQAGPTTGIDRFQAITMDTGSTTTTMSTTLGLVQRGYIPNFWVPLHGGKGALNARDTFTDTAYNPSSAFQIFTVVSNVSGSGFGIIQTTDDWVQP